MSSGNSSLSIEAELTEDVDRGCYGLYCVDAMHLAVVLEDLVDHLDTLGSSIKATQVELRSSGSILLDMERHRPVFNLESKGDANRCLLSQHYESSLFRFVEEKVDRHRGVQKLRKKRCVEAIEEAGLTSTTEAGKVQMDRAFIQDIAQTLLSEIVQESCFSSMIAAVEGEKAHHKQCKLRIENDILMRDRLMQIKKDIASLRQETKEESKRMTRCIWEMEDTEQEILFKKGLEQAYVTKVGAMTVRRRKKMCRSKERVFLERLEDLKLERVNEFRSHESMMAVIGKRKRELEEKLDYWMEKYETDKEHLQNELDEMKEQRKKDLAKIVWLKKINADYWQIIKEERRLRAVEDFRSHMVELRLRSAIKVQAWWRGTMVRNHLGPYKDAKGKDKKKDKKKKKK